MLLPKTLFLNHAGRFLPIWFFLLLYKFGAGIHYSLVAVLGARVFPLWAVGLCVGAASLIQLFLDVPAGLLIERHGALRMMRITTLCFIAVAAVLILFPLTPIVYVITIILSALGWLFFHPAVSTYLLVHGKTAYMGKLTGIRRSCEAIGITLALIGLPFFSHFSAHVLGIVILFPFIGALIALLIERRTTPATLLDPQTRSRRQRANLTIKQILTILHKLHPVGLLMGMQTLTIGIFYSMMWFLFPLLVSQSTTPAAYTIALAALDFTVLIVGIPVGILVDRFKKSHIIAIGVTITAITAFGVSLTSTFLLLLFVILLSIGDEFATIGLWAWLDEKTNKTRHEGVISGAITFLEDLGWMTGPVLAGLFATILGPSQTLFIGASLLVVNAVLTNVLLAHKK